MSPLLVDSNWLSCLPVVFAPSWPSRNVPRKKDLSESSRVLGHTFRGAMMAARPEGSGQGSTNRLSTLASYVIRIPLEGISSDPLSITAYRLYSRTNESLASITGRDRGYADIPIVLRSILTHLSTETFWDDPPLSSKRSPSPRMLTSVSFLRVGYPPRALCRGPAATSSGDPAGDQHPVL